MLNQEGNESNKKKSWFLFSVGRRQYAQTGDLHFLLQLWVVVIDSSEYDLIREELSSSKEDILRIYF